MFDVFFMSGKWLCSFAKQPTYTYLEIKQIFSKFTFQTNFKIIHGTQTIFTDIDDLDYKTITLESNLTIILLSYDKKFFKDLIKNPHDTLENASDELLNDPEIIKLACKYHPCVLRFASPEIQKNIDVVSFVCEHYGLALEYASDELRSNPKIVSIACKHDGQALEYAIDELRGDPEIVSIACYQDGLALEYASNELQDNDEIVKIAVKSDSSAIRFASYRIFPDKDYFYF